MSQQGASDGPVGGDTIVAACSAPGVGERSLVRLSGDGSHDVVRAVLDTDALPRPGRVGTARLDLGGSVHLPVVVLAWRMPRSFTGEDVVEIHLPGWPPVVTELVRRCVAHGARPAARGEFARRAVALGRIDLGQAVALGRLGSARTEQDARAAVAQLSRGVRGAHDDLRAELLAVLALLEAHVDFEDEDTESIDEAAVRDGLERLLAGTRRLADATTRGRQQDGETDVVLLGPPNAGKSLLFTRLVPGARTTVSPQAGTTRDVLEARVERAGRRYRVLDGPGVDLPAAQAAQAARDELDELDELDADAMRRHLAALPAASVVLLVEDVTDPLPADRRVERRRALRAAAAGRSVVPVLNKVDRLRPDQRPEAGGPLWVSALRGDGLPELWAAIEGAAPEPAAPDVLMRSWWEAAELIEPLLEEALAPGAASGAGDPGPAPPLLGVLPLLSVTLRDALDHLDREQDQVPDVTQEVLDRIFEGFCIGK